MHNMNVARQVIFRKAGARDQNGMIGCMLKRLPYGLFNFGVGYIAYMNNCGDPPGRLAARAMA